MNPRTLARNGPWRELGDALAHIELGVDALVAKADPDGTRALEELQVVRHAIEEAWAEFAQLGEEPKT